MTLRSGLAAQIGLGVETTWGTYAAPTRFLEFVSEGLSLDIARIESAAIRRNNRVLRSDRWVADKRGAAGPVEWEVANRGFGLLFKHMLGTAAAPATPGGATNTRDHVFTLGDMDALSFTVQVGIPDVGATTQPFSYPGAKITEWSLSSGVGELLKLTTTFDARDEELGQSLGAASYPTGQSLLSYIGGLITLDGDPIDVTDITINGSSGLKTDRHFQRRDSRKKEQVPNVLADLGGTLTAEFEDLTAYQRFVSGEVVPLIAEWQGAEIEAGFNYSAKVELAAIRFDGETPSVSGMDIVPQNLPFKVLNDGTNPPIELTYRTDDSTP